MRCRHVVPVGPAQYFRFVPPTHFFNALNLLFPDGERFFVKAVHDHIGRRDHPQLKADARAFALQEGQHAREHQEFFQVITSAIFGIRRSR